MKRAIKWMERGWIPDALIELGIRRLLDKRLRKESVRDKKEFFETLSTGPIAVGTDAANEQHYEVPAAFFETVLGPRLKYSSCIYEEGRDADDGTKRPAEDDHSLIKAEERMLALSCERAGLANGQDVLELGCGWGSLSLWMAEHYPRSRITAVSNSASQAAFIRARAQQLGLRNLAVHTCDINLFTQPVERFDRIVSVEMLEHVRNHRELLRRAHAWLKPGGKFFVHIFTHKEIAYPFEDEEADDWMSRYFFTGGIMPSQDIFQQVTDRFKVEQEWLVNGEHYGRTLRAWLGKQDAAKKQLLPMLTEVYGNKKEAGRWFQRWRVFWLACAELFEFREGTEWRVSHYLLSRVD